MASSSHGQILKSSSIIGGATAIMLLIRMVRTKALALLLGPAGVGLAGMYDSISSMAQTLSGLGIGYSAGRQIAISVASGQPEKIARTVITLRRATLVLGVLGAAIMVAFRNQLSVLSFGSREHATAIGFLSITLLFMAITGGQGALLQGMRRISDLAKMEILGTLAGAIFSIPIVYFWGIDGIPGYMLAAAAFGVLISWIYARRVQVQRVPMPAREIWIELSGMVKLGLILLASAMMASGVLFATRILVTRSLGLGAVGQFQAASSLSLIYIGFILQAMGTDFYPRLTGVSHDNRKCNQMVNEQMEVSLLLGLPGIVGTIAFAPLVIQLFYSSKFGPAGDILVWQTAGMFLRLLCWPMGYILVAKGKGKLFFYTEITAHSLHILLVWAGLHFFGLIGAGAAFFGMYLVYCALIYGVVAYVSGFNFSPRNLRLGWWGALAVAFAVAAHFLFSRLWASLLSGVVTLVAGLICLRMLVGVVNVEQLNRNLQKFYVPEFVKGWLGRWCAASPAGTTPDSDQVTAATLDA